MFGFSERIEAQNALKARNDDGPAKRVQTTFLKRKVVRKLGKGHFLFLGDLFNNLNDPSFERHHQFPIPQTRDLWCAKIPALERLIVLCVEFRKNGSAIARLPLLGCAAAAGYSVQCASLTKSPTLSMTVTSSPAWLSRPKRPLAPKPIEALADRGYYNGKESSCGQVGVTAYVPRVSTTGAPGVDKQRIEQFEADSQKNLPPPYSP